jgi:hypothetical protein
LPKATNDAGSGGGDTSAPEPDAGQVDVPPGYTGFGFQEFNTAPAYAPRAGVSGAPGMVGAYPALPMPTPQGLVAYPPYAMPAAGAYPQYAAPGAPMPAQPARRGRSVGCIVLYALLAVLVIFVGLGVTVYQVGSHIGASVQAKQAAAMQLYQQVTSKQPDLAEPLTDSTPRNWYTYQGATYGCALQNDGLHVHTSDANRFIYCTDADSAVSNIAFQVQMQILSGDGGGLVFHENSDSQGLYAFELNQDGSYQVFISKDPSKQASDLTDGTTSAADLQSGATNTLTLIEQGPQCYFYVNGRFVVQVQDSTLQEGSAGVLAGDEGNATEVVYTNEKIWDLNS